MIDQQEAFLLETFIRKSTLPILYARDDKTDSIGTGTLFMLRERFFLITARHLFDYQRDPKSFGYPALNNEGETFTFGKFDLIRSDDPQFDVAIMELRESITISRLMASWSFLSREFIALPSKNGLFLLSGYPEALTIEDQGRLKGSLFTFYTNRLEEIPDEALGSADEDVDLFFCYGESAELHGGQPTNTPKLEGASGASVWEYFPSTSSTIWIPYKLPKVVGIQSTYIHSKYFRAVSWMVAANMLNKLDSRLLAF